MNVPTIKLVCWLAALASLVGLAKYAHDWFGTRGKRLLPIDPEYVAELLNEDTQVAPDVREIVDYEALKTTFKTMNWTGKPPPPPPVARDPGDAAKPKPKPIEEILNVIMLQVDTGDAGGSLAHVTYIKERLPAVLRVGTALRPPYDYAVVHRIRPGLIEFAFTDPDRPNESIGPAAQDPELIVKTGPDGPILPGRDLLPRKQVKPEDRHPQTTQTGNGNFELGPEDMQQFADDYPRILTEDVITDTYWKDGKRAGVEIKSVKEGSIAARHGAMQGDVLISINGHKVTSENEAISYVKQNSEKYTVWEVLVLRYGKEETLVYHSQ